MAVTDVVYSDSCTGSVVVHDPDVSCTALTKIAPDYSRSLGLTDHHFQFFADSLMRRRISSVGAAIE